MPRFAPLINFSRSYVPFNTRSFWLARNLCGKAELGRSLYIQSSAPCSDLHSTHTHIRCAMMCAVRPLPSTRNPSIPEMCWLCISRCEQIYQIDLQPRKKMTYRYTQYIYIIYTFQIHCSVLLCPSHLDLDQTSLIAILRNWCSADKSMSNASFASCLWNPFVPNCLALRCQVLSQELRSSTFVCFVTWGMKSQWERTMWSDAVNLGHPGITKEWNKGSPRTQEQTAKFTKSHLLRGERQPEKKTRGSQAVLSPHASWGIDQHQTICLVYSVGVCPISIDLTMQAVLPKCRLSFQDAVMCRWEFSGWAGRHGSASLRFGKRNCQTQGVCFDCFGFSCLLHSKGSEAGYPFKSSCMTLNLTWTYSYKLSILSYACRPHTGL